MKMDIRKKAMSAMMKEAPAQMMMKKKPAMKVAIKVGPAGEMPEGEEMESPEMEEEDKAGEGYEQMMVSPEEKKMLMEMRGESEGEDSQMHANKGLMMPKGPSMMAPKPKGY